jgi:phenylalanyl-tRNA synthetase beta chain
MRFSLLWLKEHIHVTADLETLTSILTQAGIEVEAITPTGVTDENIIIAEILSYTPHPNADRLRLCQVNTGKQTLQIVCGASNFKAGDRVPLALPGATLPGNIKIKETKIRGQLSQGMMCSAKELNIAEDTQGLLILDTQAPIGTPLHHYIPPDTFIDIEITPNRPDLTSYIGLARELAALNVGTLIHKHPAPIPIAPSPSPPTYNTPSLTIQNLAPTTCPYYTATLLENVTIAPSPPWLVKKIEATGHRSINNAVDITNYILWETGQPLHAFDADTLAGHTIIIRHAHADEAFQALDDLDYKLTTDDVVIADNENPQALAGVIGGRLSGVSSRTTRILLEAAFFDPTSVRRCARRHNIHTDSSYRFERRTDPHALLDARDRAIALLIELCGARLAQAPIILGNPPAPHPPITLRTQRTAQILGHAIDQEKIKRHLSALGLKLKSETLDTTIWQAPTYRHDLQSHIDLIEEIVRLEGMHSIPSRLTYSTQLPSADDLRDQRLQSLRKALAARGWHETLGDPLLAPEAHAIQAALPLLNPLSEHHTHLRPNLISSLLKAAAHNLSRANTGIKLFEINRVTSPQGHESLHLALLLTGHNHDPHWLLPQREYDYYDLTATTHLLEKQFALPHDALITPPQAITRQIKKLYGIKRSAFVAEYDLTQWIDAPITPPRTLPLLPVFPSSRRDLAMLVDPKITHGEICQTINLCAPPILERYFLFDLFTDPTGEKIPADKKSLAYAFVFRHPERTLLDSEVDEAITKIQNALVSSHQALIRKVESAT